MSTLHFAMTVSPEHQTLFRAKLGEPPPEAPQHLVLYDPPSKGQALELTLTLLATETDVKVTKLPVSVPTLLTSRVLSVSWQSLLRHAKDGMEFSLTEATLENVLHLLCKRAHHKIRPTGEFDRIMHKLSQKYHVRKRTLRTMYGKLWRSLYPDEPLYKGRKPRYPWWRHIRRDRPPTL